VADSEYGWHYGDRVESGFVHILFAAVDLDTGERHAFWGRDARLKEFIRDRGDDLFIGFNVLAEMTYLLRLGIDPPRRWWDAMLAYRYVSNGQDTGEYNLVAALHNCQLNYALTAEKDDLQERLGSLNINPDDPAELRQILRYCIEDAEAAGRLYRRLAAEVPGNWMDYAMHFVRATARQELRGIGIDTTLYSRILEERERIIEAVTADVNRTYPIFTSTGTLLKRRFLTWCIRNGVPWPMTVSPHTGLKMFSFDKRTRERMKHAHPFIADMHEAMKTVTQLHNRDMAVDFRRRRHFYGTIPFATSTGRNSFRGYLMSGPKWMRFLAAPCDPEHALVNVDLKCEEIGFMAGISGDRNLLSSYLAPTDPHMAFAILARAAPPWATEKTHKAVRNKYKAVNFAVSYGQGAYGLARDTGMHLCEAVRLLKQHKQSYADLWHNAKIRVRSAFAKGRCETLDGWPRRVEPGDNWRSVMNFAIQGGGAALMRVATVYLSRAGLQLLGSNHDSFLLECARAELPEVERVVNLILSQTVSQVLPTVPLKWKTEIFEGRFIDSDGSRLWQRVTDTVNRCTFSTQVQGVGEPGGEPARVGQGAIYNTKYSRRN
jgi:DNA polymerase I-like protein with 3'-5' exonuclease and polymerase domains